MGWVYDDLEPRCTFPQGFEHSLVNSELSELDPPWKIAARSFSSVHVHLRHSLHSLILDLFNHRLCCGGHHLMSSVGREVCAASGVHLGSSLFKKEFGYFSTDVCV